MVGNYKSEKTFKKEPTAAEKEAIQMQKDKEFAQLLEEVDGKGKKQKKIKASQRKSSDVQQAGQGSKKQKELAKI